MKILRKKDYDDLINQIKSAEDKVRDQKNIMKINSSI